MRELLRTRRDGGLHSREALDALACGAADGSLPDYALSAWLMAAYLNPLTKRETVDLTLAMAASGERVDLAGLPEPWLDKHSTGGVGDKTTIVLLPLLAACGLTVVKMSGRGLGITGGTVDKLESVPGFRTDLSVEEMKAQAGRIGLALTGQTPRLAPADGRLYALRDVTETVDSIPLIAASILSKKIAGGADTVILDVKCGAGAFMTSLAQARELRAWLTEIGEACGLRVAARITDMDEPLGSAVGNRIEIEEAIRVLASEPNLPPPTLRFRALCVEFAVLALVVGDEGGEPEARRRVAAALTSGAALAKAHEWFAAQGATELPRPSAPSETVAASVLAPGSGWLARVDARAVGETVVSLGGGRAKKGDPLDHEVGVLVARAVGERVQAGEPLLSVLARTPEAARAAAERLTSAISVSTEPVEPPPLFLD